MRQEIAQTRSELADTVDQLSDKLDVKQQAADKVSDVKQKVTETAHKAKQSAPEPVQRALDAAGAKASPVAHKSLARRRHTARRSLPGWQSSPSSFLCVGAGPS